MAMSWNHVLINIVMVVIGVAGGYLLGRWTAKVAREEQAVNTDTGMIRVQKKRWRFNQVLGGLIVFIVLLLMVSGAITQASYDARLQCNSDYISQFQETLRQNAARTQAANEAELRYISAQRDFLAGVGDAPDPGGLRNYVQSLETYQQSLDRAREERLPYPTNPNCEDN